MQFNRKALNIPPVDSPFFEEWISAQKDVPANWIRWAKELNEKGYTVLEGAVDKNQIDKAVASIQNLYPNEPGVEPVRYQDLWKQNEYVKNFAAQADILSFLNFAYGRAAIPFQTLNFKYGTQQCIHSDTIHFSCIPHGFMCGVWVAFEDLDTNNGPLLYSPGSHKLKEYNYFDLNIPFNKDDYEYYPLYEDFIKEMIKARGLPVTELHIKKGDAMIWAANLLHGGKEILDKKRTRWSQVTHYYFENCVYYTPMYSEESCGKLYVRDITDAATGKKVKNKIRGQEVELMGDGRKRYWVADEFQPKMYLTLSDGNKTRFVDEIIKNEKKVPLLIRTLKNKKK